MTEERPSFKVVAVVVSYGDPGDATALVARLRESSEIAVVVVDNSDSFPPTEQVTVIDPGINLGFGRGVNRGAAERGAPWVALVNPDTDVDAAQVLELVARAEQTADVGVIGPRLAYPDGRPQINGGRHSGLIVELSRSLSLGASLRRIRGRLRREFAVPARSPHAKLLDRQWISGACMVIKAEAWQACGGFDEDFFMYFEDEDLCRRIGANGWRVVMHPGVTVRHRVGSSLGANPYRTPAFQRSRVAYHRKHSSAWLQQLVTLSARRKLRRRQ